MALQKITCKLDSLQTSFVSFRCYFGTVLFTAAANHEAFFRQQVSESQLPVLASPNCQSLLATYQWTHKNDVQELSHLPLN